MPSTKKLTTYRSNHFDGPRRKKPRVRRLNRAVRERVDQEHDLVQQLVRDADVRRALWRGMHAVQGNPEPYTVWNDFDPFSSQLTELAPNLLPRWEDVGEFLKIHLLFQVALEDGGYAFTARVRPDLEERWDRDGKDHMDRIRRETRKELIAQGLKDIEYFYVVETRSRRGGARVPMHLHGFFLTQDPLTATRFKVAMERSIAVHPRGRRAAGTAPKSGPEVLVEPVYDVEDDSPHGRGRWAGYIAKNATRLDARLKRRVFMSRSATQTIREFWALLREEPLS